MDLEYDADRARSGAANEGAMTVSSERELTEPVDLCDSAGHLNPEAIGWSRVPLHRANLRGAYGRKKRWDYWCFINSDLYVAVTYADVDYLGITAVWIHQPSTGFTASIEPPAPFARGFVHTERSGVGTMSVRNAVRVGNGPVDLRIEDRPDATLIKVTAERTAWGPLDLDVAVERPEGHESLNVVIPWSLRRFQYTAKDNSRRVRGHISIGDRRFDLGAEGDETTWGILDVGRGLWRYNNRWNWASGSGIASGGAVVGLQFGGKWTEGTGYNENALCVDGRLHKIHNELSWDYDWDHPLRPWRVIDPVGGLVEATLSPTHDRHSKVSIGVLSMEVHQVFGTWAGTITSESGDLVTFDAVVGFAEEARNRW